MNYLIDGFVADIRKAIERAVEKDTDVKKRNVFEFVDFIRFIFFVYLGHYPRKIGSLFIFVDHSRSILRERSFFHFVFHLNSPLFRFVEIGNC